MPPGVYTYNTLIMLFWKGIVLFRFCRCFRLFFFFFIVKATIMGGLEQQRVVFFYAVGLKKKNGNHSLCIALEIIYFGHLFQVVNSTELSQLLYSCFYVHASNYEKLLFAFFYPNGERQKISAMLGLSILIHFHCSINMIHTELLFYFRTENYRNYCYMSHYHQSTVLQSGFIKTFNFTSKYKM